jgi:hypothetical protein
MNWLGFEVIESKWLPPDLVLLRSGKTLLIHDTRTGETRTTEIPPFTLAPPVAGSARRDEGER